MKPLREQLREQLSYNLGDQLGYRIRAQLVEQLWEELSYRIGSQIEDQIWRQLQEDAKLVTNPVHMRSLANVVVEGNPGQAVFAAGQGRGWWTYKILTSTARVKTDIESQLMSNVSLPQL